MEGRVEVEQGGEGGLVGDEGLPDRVGQAGPHLRHRVGDRDSDDGSPAGALAGRGAGAGCSGRPLSQSGR